MKKILLPLTRIITFGLPLVLLASCGGDGASAVPGNVIDMHVTTTTWNVIFGAPATFQNEPVLISLRTPTGYQLGTNDLHVLLDLSPGSYTGAPPMRIFEETSPGNNDFTKELIPMPYTTQPDPSGNKVLQLNMQLGNGGNGSYRGILYVYSGSTVGTATFEVKCVPPPGQTPAPC